MGWGLKLEALKVVQACVQYVGKSVADHLPALMSHAWQLFLNSQALYQHLVINNSSDTDLHEVICSAMTAMPAHAVLWCVAAQHGLLYHLQHAACLSTFGWNVQPRKCSAFLHNQSIIPPSAHAVACSNAFYACPIQKSQI